MAIGIDDLGRAGGFCDAALAPLGIERVPSKHQTGAAWRRTGGAATLHPSGRAALQRPTGAPRQGLDGATFAAALTSGGHDEGAPDYHGAHVQDPDGNKLHFVRRGT